MCESPGALGGLLFALSLLLCLGAVLPSLALVVLKRKWPPFQERGQWLICAGVSFFFQMQLSRRCACALAMRPKRECPSCPPPPLSLSSCICPPANAPVVGVCAGGESLASVFVFAVAMRAGYSRLSPARSHACQGGVAVRRVSACRSCDTVPQRPGERHFTYARRRPPLRTRTPRWVAAAARLCRISSSRCGSTRSAGLVHSSAHGSAQRFVVGGTGAFRRAAHPAASSRSSSLVPAGATN